MGNASYKTCTSSTVIDERGDGSPAPPPRPTYLTDGKHHKGAELPFELIVQIERATTWKKSQIHQLHKKFKQLSGPDSSTISRDVFMRAFVTGTHLARKHLSDSAFGMFDQSGSGSINFEEFCGSLSLCCGEDHKRRLKFLFDMYDSDKDTFMSRDELELFLESLIPDLKDFMPPGGPIFEEDSDDDDDAKTNSSSKSKSAPPPKRQSKSKSKSKRSSKSRSKSKSRSLWRSSDVTVTDTPSKSKSSKKPTSTSTPTLSVNGVDAGDGVDGDDAKTVSTSERLPEYEELPEVHTPSRSARRRLLAAAGGSSKSVIKPISTPPRPVFSDDAEAPDIGADTTHHRSPSLVRSLSDTLPTFEESQQAEQLRESALQLLAFVDKHNGQLPFDVFADWAKDHVEVSVVLQRFEILPTREDERRQILVIMNDHSQLAVGQSWCVLNSTWWDMWKEYVNYPDRQGVAVDTAQAGLLGGEAPLEPDEVAGVVSSRISASEEGDADRGGEMLSRESSRVRHGATRKVSPPSATTVPRGGQRPVSIDNLPLESTEGILKDGLDENRDYVLVPQKAWNCFRDWYGGGPTIERFVIQTGNSGYKRIELYPIFLSIWQMGTKDKGTKDAKLETVRPEKDDKLTMRTSSQRTVPELFEEACKMQEVDPRSARLWYGDGESQWQWLQWGTGDGDDGEGGGLKAPSTSSASTPRGSKSSGGGGALRATSSIGGSASRSSATDASSQRSSLETAVSSSSSAVSNALNAARTPTSHVLAAFDALTPTASASAASKSLDFNTASLAAPDAHQSSSSSSSSPPAGASASAASASRSGDPSPKKSPRSSPSRSPSHSSSSHRHQLEPTPAPNSRRRSRVSSTSLPSVTEENNAATDSHEPTPSDDALRDSAEPPTPSDPQRPPTPPPKPGSLSPRPVSRKAPGDGLDDSSDALSPDHITERGVEPQSATPRDALSTADLYIQVIDPTDTLEDLGFTCETAVLIEVQNEDGRWRMEEYQSAAVQWAKFEVGTVLDVKDHLSDWYLSDILEVKETQVEGGRTEVTDIFVHYHGWVKKWDTWKSTDSICKCPARECNCKGQLAPPRTHSAIAKERTRRASTHRSNLAFGRAQNREIDDGMPGATGLFNLGNTCFMNSSLQCLSNAPNLTPHFLNKWYEKDINKKNPLGTGGKLAKTYAALLEELWSGKYSAVAPNAFKKALSQIAPQFSGYQQHDSHELLSYLLDGLHEDLNRIKEKPITEKVESTGGNDVETAKLAWETHLKRNVSIVVEVFQAQLRSEVVCPEPKCGHVSITFDPFMYLSVPLPRATTRYIPLTLFALNKRPIRFVVQCDRYGSVRDLKSDLEEMCDVSAEYMSVCIVSKNSVFNILNDHKHLSSMRYNETDLAVFEQDPELKPERPKDVRYSGIMHEIPRDVELAPGEKSRRFGNPFALIYSKKIAADELRDFLWKCVSSYVPAEFTKENPPYEVKVMSKTRSHESCGMCRTIRCKGCTLPDKLKKEIPDNVAFTLVWNDDIWEEIDKNMEEMTIVDQSVLEEEARIKTIRQSKVSNQSNQTVSLYDCLRSYMKREVLGKNDAWYCSKCKVHQCATKKIDIWSSPEILVIQIKRFLVHNGYREKIGTAVDFPISGLDLREFVMYKDQDVPIYDLFAISNHFGNLGGGHYTAAAKNLKNGHWYYFDDSNCRRIDVSRVKTSNAYVLFYQRRH